MCARRWVSCTRRVTSPSAARHGESCGRALDRRRPRRGDRAASATRCRRAWALADRAPPTCGWPGRPGRRGSRGSTRMCRPRCAPSGPAFRSWGQSLWVCGRVPGRSSTAWLRRQRARHSTGTMRGRLDARTNDSSIGGGARLRVDDLGGCRRVRAGRRRRAARAARNLRGTLDADLRVSGTAARPVAHVTLRARDVHAAGVPRLAPWMPRSPRPARRCASRPSRSQLGPTRLQASGSYAWSGTRRCPVRCQPPATSPCWRARSSRRCRSRAPRSSRAGPGAPWNRRRWTPRSTHRHVSIDGTDVGPTRATFALAGNRLRVEASAPALAVVARGDLDTRAPYRYQAEVRLDRARLPALVPLRLREQVPISDGTVAGTFRAKGTLRQPMPDSADATLDELDAVVNGTRIVLEAPAAIAWTPGRVAVTGVSLRAGRGAHARISGLLGAEPAGDPLRITAGSPLSELVALAGPQLPADAQPRRGRHLRARPGDRRDAARAPARRHPLRPRRQGRLWRSPAGHRPRHRRARGSGAHRPAVARCGLAAGDASPPMPPCPGG